MADDRKLEVWLRGPLTGVPPLLQPVAHALLQAREEVNGFMNDFPEILLWVKPSGLAAPAFHLQHLAGVLDRLFTYARGEQLTPRQLNNLAMEGKMTEIPYSIINLLETFNRQVDDSIKQLSAADELTLTDKRGVGRNQLPSTVIGLYTHAAEHTMRHVGHVSDG